MDQRQYNYNRSQAARRRAARRKKVIRNRIIFGVVLAVLAGLLIFLLVKLFTKDDAPAPESVSFTETTAAEPAEETTPAAAADTTAPVITGVQDLSVAAGGTISYKQGVTVTDDTDPAPSLEVDASAVDLSVPGTYTVTYTATDASGNSATATAAVTVTEAASTGTTASEEDIARMKYLAGLYLDQIKQDIGKPEDEITQYDLAKGIWAWSNWEIDYSGTSDKSDWVMGALQAFDTHKGDCFTYFCAAKALLEQAGIQNIDVVKSDTSHSSHYWSLVNLGDGWYHYDTTPRDGDGDYFFLVTDEQLDAYSEAHENSHIFDHDAYPARATEIITDLNGQPPHE